MSAGRRGRIGRLNQAEYPREWAEAGAGEVGSRRGMEDAVGTQDVSSHEAPSQSCLSNREVGLWKRTERLLGAGK